MPNWFYKQLEQEEASNPDSIISKLRDPNDQKSHEKNAK